MTTTDQDIFDHVFSTLQQVADSSVGKRYMIDIKKPFQMFAVAKGVVAVIGADNRLVAVFDKDTFTNDDVEESAGRPIFPEVLFFSPLELGEKPLQAVRRRIRERLHYQNGKRVVCFKKALPVVKLQIEKILEAVKWYGERVEGTSRPFQISWATPGIALAVWSDLGQTDIFYDRGVFASSSHLDVSDRTDGLPSGTGLIVGGGPNIDASIAHALTYITRRDRQQIRWNDSSS